MLDDAQLNSFDSDGFLVVENVLPAELLARLREEYGRLLDELYENWLSEGKVTEADGFEERLKVAYAAGCDWFQPMDISLPGDRIHADTPMHFGPAVFDMVKCSKILDIVEQLIGPEITSTPIQHVRIKPPAAQLQADEIRAHVTRTAWHQDRAVGLAEADQTDMVTVWIAVSDATVENGCLQVIPGAHRNDMLPHCPKDQTAIADGFIDEQKAMPLPVGSGGIVLLHPLLPHASLPNKSEGVRWSFDLRYNKTGQPTGRAHFPEFVARSRQNSSAELTDWKIWRQSWHDARARLAVSEHIDIHRWSGDAPACA